MYCLAIEKEPITLNQLQQDLLVSVSAKKLLEAVKSLKMRSLIQQTAGGFTQQPVVMEYLIERQIDTGKCLNVLQDYNNDVWCVVLGAGHLCENRNTAELKRCYSVSTCSG